LAIAHRLGRKALEELAAAAKPDMLLAWYRKHHQQVRWVCLMHLLGKKFASQPQRQPAFIEPMECLAVTKLPDGPEWVYEILSWMGIGLSPSNQMAN
jgi:hypothetical protein